ncbi:hypothetical protein V6N12_040834 [Hibiscus sabdariffa]|uniref:Uncharacterized protein n=1 Tax=Hibiscus sabdariffa TaxID=183260 RepID=A0ABR2E4W3_9ROSI
MGSSASRGATANSDGKTGRIKRSTMKRVFFKNRKGGVRGFDAYVSVRCLMQSIQETGKFGVPVNPCFVFHSFGWRLCFLVRSKAHQLFRDMSGERISKLRPNRSRF